MSESRHPTSLLEKLPTELRFLVYEHMVASPDGIVSLELQPLTHVRPRRKLQQQSCSHKFWSAQGRSPPQSLGILRACTWVYAEAAEVFYRQTFSFKTASALQAFLVLQRPKTGRSRLRYLQVNVSGSEWAFMPIIAEQVAELVNLKKLAISEVGHKITRRSMTEYLNCTGRPPASWPASQASWDQLTGIKLARDTYAYLYPLFAKVIREQGTEKLAEMVEFDLSYSLSWIDCLWPRSIHMDMERRSTHRRPRSTEQRISISRAMADEVVRLMETDT